MTQLTKTDLTDALREVFTEQNTIGGDQHHNQHEFVQMLMDREERRLKRVEKFKMSFIGGVALSLLGGLVWLGKVAVAHIHWN